MIIQVNTELYTPERQLLLSLACKLFWERVMRANIRQMSTVMHDKIGKNQTQLSC